MARVLKGSQFYLHTLHSSATRGVQGVCSTALLMLRNEPYLPLPSQPKLVLIYRPQRDGKLSWPWVAGWLHTEISVRHQVDHLSTNRARRRLTLLIEANALTTMPDHRKHCIWPIQQMNETIQRTSLLPGCDETPPQCDQTVPAKRDKYRS